MKVTTEDIELNLWGSQVVIPKGTEVIKVKGASGTLGDLYAVRSVKLLVTLTGNSHDPVYRYVFVSSDKVGEAP